MRKNKIKGPGGNVCAKGEGGTRLGERTKEKGKEEKNVDPNLI